MSRNFEILTRGASVPLVQPVRVAPKIRTERRAYGSRGSAMVDGEMKKLVRSVFIYPPGEKPPAVVVFCGVDEGVGCSWVCIQCGQLLAEAVPGRICIVDASLKSPSIGAYFDAETGPGLLEALRDSAPLSGFVRPTPSSHLWFLASGAARNELNGTFNAERLRARISELRKEFDHVLIDTPPLSVHPDAALLAHLADGAVLIVKSNVTRRESARAAKETLEAARVPILGAILNQRTYPIPEALYRRL